MHVIAVAGITWVDADDASPSSSGTRGRLSAACSPRTAVRPRKSRPACPRQIRTGAKEPVALRDCLRGLIASARALLAADGRFEDGRAAELSSALDPTGWA